MPEGKKPTFRSLLVTQLVSGVWHGLFPGHAMFFFNTAFMFESAKIVSCYERGSAWQVPHMLQIVHLSIIYYTLAEF